MDPQGEELSRFAKPIRCYGYIWDGTFDRQGRYWRQDEHAADEELVDEETGPYEESFRSYFKSYDLSTEEVDSVHLGESIWRGYASVTERASSYSRLPFAVSNVAVVDPSGGFWNTNTGSYRLVCPERLHRRLVLDPAAPTNSFWVECRGMTVFSPTH